MNACTLRLCHMACRGAAGCVHVQAKKPFGPISYSVSSGADVFSDGFVRAVKNACAAAMMFFAGFGVARWWFGV